jgi:hypothetical protein
VPTSFLQSFNPSCLASSLPCFISSFLRDLLACFLIC